jgi:hypothetical protein
MDLYYCWGYTKMEFKRVTELTNTTPTEALCEAWNLTAEDVDARKREETPLTIREAGSLAELHGMKLEDILSVLSI